MIGRFLKPQLGDGASLGLPLGARKEGAPGRAASTSHFSELLGHLSGRGKAPVPASQASRLLVPDPHPQAGPIATSRDKPPSETAARSPAIALMDKKTAAGAIEAQEDAASFTAEQLEVESERATREGRLIAGDANPTLPANPLATDPQVDGSGKARLFEQSFDKAARDPGVALPAGRENERPRGTVPQQPLSDRIPAMRERAGLPAVDIPKADVANMAPDAVARPDSRPGGDSSLPGRVREGVRIEGFSASGGAEARARPIPLPPLHALPRSAAIAPGPELPIRAIVRSETHLALSVPSFLTAMPAPAVAPPAPVEQVAEAVRSFAASAATHHPARDLVLALDPAELGSVTVRLRLRGNALEVIVATSRPETAVLLEEDRSRLAQLLQASGCSIEEADIRVQEGARLSGGQAWPLPLQAGAQPPQQPMHGVSGQGDGTSSNRQQPGGKAPGKGPRHAEMDSDPGRRDGDIYV